MAISQECQNGEHDKCFVQMTVNYELTNCQCNCHPGTVSVSKDMDKVLKEQVEEQKRAAAEGRI
jgi:hypothetical protein